MAAKPKVPAAPAIETPDPKIEVPVDEVVEASDVRAADISGETFTPADGSIVLSRRKDFDMGMPPAETTTADADPVPLMVTVVGPAKGRWRAGRLFGPEPISIPNEWLSEADKAALIADPLLIVSTS